MSALPYHLLELNVISAQDLSSGSRNMRTYAITWINPDRKLRTRIDQEGQINPTWNDKFVFRVDEKFLDSETSSVMVEIYAVGWFRHALVGSVRVLISNLLPPDVRYQRNSTKRRFVALQIRRPSGRPQGILNMGVTLLDNTMKSMPLYTQLSASAVGFQDLMGAVQLDSKQSNPDKDGKAGENDNKETKTLRRTRSDCTDIKAKKEEDNLLDSCVGHDAPMGNGSVVNGSCLNGSMLNGSEIGGAKNGSVCISDVGPSPSVVAAAVARGLYPTPLMKPHNPGSSILADWTADDTNVEGLQSKIERWKMELPGDYESNSTISYQKKPKNRKKRGRRHSFDEPSGGFTCFGNALGCEITIVCGADNKKSRPKSRSYNKFQSDSEVDSQMVR